MTDKMRLHPEKLRRLPKNEKVKELPHKPGLYAVRIKSDNKIVYIGYSISISKACLDIVHRVSSGSERALCRYLRDKEYEFTVLEITSYLTENDRKKLHLDAVKAHLTALYPSLNSINPVTGKKFNNLKKQKPV